jgi:uncharacterized protein (TIGR03435 family)
MLTRMAVGFFVAQAGLCGADFEALAVRPSDIGARNSSMRGGPGTNSPDRLAYSRVTLKSLIERAYGVEAYQVIGPPWLEAERYDLAAKLPPGTTKQELRDLLRKALKERFGLAAHLERRELPAYELSIAKGGMRLTKQPDGGAPATVGEPQGEDASPVVTAGPDGIPILPKDQASGMLGMILPGRAAIRAKRQSMSQLAKLLTDLVDRPVLDHTSVADEFDFTLTWAPERRSGQGPLGNVMPPERSGSAGGGGATELPTAAEPGLTIFGAVESQLGLTLKATRSVVEVLIVDHAEKTPTAN